MHYCCCPTVCPAQAFRSAAAANVSNAVRSPLEATNVTRVAAGPFPNTTSVTVLTPGADPELVDALQRDPTRAFDAAFLARFGGSGGSVVDDFGYPPPPKPPTEALPPGATLPPGTMLPPPSPPSPVMGITATLGINYTRLASDPALLQVGQR